MKSQVCFFIQRLLLIGILSISICNNGIAQKTKKSRAARRAAEKAEQARLNKLEYDRVLYAFKTDRWAFETPQLVDDSGMPIEGQHHPNVVGFNGEELEAFVVYRYEVKSFSREQPDFRYESVHYRGKVVSQKHYTNKKGWIIYKYTVAPPFSAEVTIELPPDTPFGNVTIHPRGKSVHYQGKFMPISECWYYIKVDQGRKKK